MKKLVILLFGVLIILIAISTYKNYSQQKAEDSDIPTISTLEETNTSEDTYQNGEFTGFVKSVHRDQNGNVSLGIDMIQTFGGKEAFLALAEDFSNGKNKSGDWSFAKDKFKSFEDLSKYVKTLTEEQFEEFFHAYQVRARESGGSAGIFDSFPNGFGYYRNVSNKIRTYQVASSVKNVGITNSEEPVNIENFYAICTMSPEQVMPYMQKKGMNNPFSCENQVFVTVSKGVINKIRVLFRS